MAAPEVCIPDRQRTRLLWPCMASDDMIASARRYAPSRCWDDPDGFPLGCISRRAVAYSCGAMARDGETMAHIHPVGETALCRWLADEAAAVMAGMEVGMGSEGTPEHGSDAFLPFFVTAGLGDTRGGLTEERIRRVFGGVLYPRCSVLVEPLEEYGGEWWEAVEHWYGYDPEAEGLAGWRRALRWFWSREEFRETAFVVLGRCWDDGGFVFPRLAVGLTAAGSLAGVMGCVVHT